jgi:transposase
MIDSTLAVLPAPFGPSNARQSPAASVRSSSQDLSLHVSQLRSWVKVFADDPQQAFPGQGPMKPEQAEIARLKREVIKLKAERDILKKAAAYFAKEST